MPLNPDFWDQLSDSPTDHPQIRASDADRTVVFNGLGEAYAEGLLSSDEHAERMDRAGQVKVLGDIPMLMEDLVAPMGSPGTLERSQSHQLEQLKASAEDVPTTPDEIDAAAKQQYRTALIATGSSFIGPSVICLAIWLFVSLGAGHMTFPWPLFVMLGTGMGFFTTLMSKDSMIRDRKRKLTMRARAHLGDAEAKSALEANPGAYAVDDPRHSREDRKRLRDERRRNRGSH